MFNIAMDRCGLPKNAHSSVTYREKIYVLTYPGVKKKGDCFHDWFVLNTYRAICESPHLPDHPRPNRPECLPVSPDMLMYVNRDDAINAFMDTLLKKLNEFSMTRRKGGFESWYEFCTCQSRQNNYYYFGIHSSQYCMLCRACNLPYWSSKWGSIPQNVGELQRLLRTVASKQLSLGPTH